MTPEQARANGAPEIEASVYLTTPSPTRASELTFSVQFREVVTGLDGADFVVTGFSDNGTGPGTTAQVTDVEPVLPAGPFPRFQITVGSGDLAEFSGQVGLGFSTDAQVLVGDRTRSPTVNPRANQAYFVDNMAPRARSIVRQNPRASRTNATELVFRAAFDEAVGNVTTASFAVTGGSTAEITGIDPVAGGLAYDVTVSGGNLDAYDGQVGLSVAIDTDPPIQDAVGNALASSTPISDSEQFTIDTIGPRLGNVSRAPGRDAITNEDVVVFRLSFIGAANDVGAADFVVTGGTTATITNVEKVSPFVYDLTVSGGDLNDFDGEVGLTFSSSPTITDEIGNPLTDTKMPAINQTFTLDNTGASVQIRSEAGNLVGNRPFTVTITFNEPVSGFTKDDIGVTNATLSDFDGSGDSYSVVVTPDGDGDVVLSVAAGVAQDAAGNDNGAAQPLTVEVDATGATVQILDAPKSFIDLEPFAIRILFSEPVTGFSEGDLAVKGANVRSFQGTEALYTAMIEPAGNADVTLSIGAEVAFDELDNPNTASEIVTVANGLSQHTQRVIADFLSTRANHIVSNPANLTGLLTGTGRGDVNAQGNDDGLALNFAARLGVDGPIANQRIGAAFGDPADAKQDRSFDVWTQVSAAFSNADGADSDFFVGYFGAHYFVTPDVLVGTMMQLDWSEHVDGAARAEGRGWMVGPYIVARTPDQAIAFEARTAWGRSHNTVAPLGTFEDDFDTERWLATAELSGAFEVGSITFMPSARVSYFRERQQAYTDSLGNEISEQTLELGEFRFGPGFAHDMSLNETVRLQTQLGVSGVWNFEVGAGTLAANTPAGTDRLRARIDGQARFTDLRGPSVVATGFYDGIGAPAYQSWGGGLRFVVPLGND